MKIKNNELIFAVVFFIFIIFLSLYSTFFSKKDENVAKLVNPEDVVTLTSEEIEKLIKNGAPVLGNMDAKVTVVEFADFQCPYCEEYFKEVFPEIKKTYIDTGKIKFIYMNSVFMGEESMFAAEGAKCAKEQNKFWEYHDRLYENQQGRNSGAFSIENLKKFGVELNLNTKDFNKCLDSNKYKKVIEDELELAKTFGVSATPTTFINDFSIKGLQGVSYFLNRIEAGLNGELGPRL